MHRVPILLALALVAGCSSASNDTATAPPEQAFDTAADTATAAKPAAGGTQGDPGQLAVSLPKLAYTYKLGFLLPGNAIARAQSDHAALCDRLGASRCQMMGMERSLGDDQTGTATTKFRVATGIARQFQADLTNSVAKAGGRATDTDIQADDVSKDMVDAQARIDHRTLLVKRLTDILRNRQGKVSELVEAERSVAQAQEELDSAKAWLAELRGRVAMSTFTVTYRAVAPTAAPSGNALSDAVAASWSAFVIGLRMLLTLVIFLLPWAVIGGLVWLAVRAIRRRREPVVDEG